MLNVYLIDKTNSISCIDIPGKFREYLAVEQHINGNEIIIIKASTMSEPVQYHIVYTTKSLAEEATLRDLRGDEYYYLDSKNQLCCLTKELRQQKEQDLLLDEEGQYYNDYDLDDIHCLDNFFFDEDCDLWFDEPVQDDDLCDDTGEVNRGVM